MEIWLLKEKEGAPKNNIGCYDTFDGFIIRAETAKRARLIAYDHSDEKAWKNPKITSCIPINKTGEEEIILSSYNAG